MNQKDFSILIGGEAGQGSRKAGLIIAEMFNQLGYKVLIYDDYQSLIKGGHSFSLIRVSAKQVFSHCQKIDFLLALDKRTITEHQQSLNGMIIFNQDRVESSQGTGIAAETIVKECQGSLIMANTALIAGFAKIVGIEWSVLEEVLRREIKKEIAKNLEIAKKAFESESVLVKIKKLKNAHQLLLTGNEAVALGGVRAGLEMYYAYPMTPATGILHYLAEHSQDLNVCVSQLENEIAIINAALGSAYAGKRSMVGTSGGGFALMVEALSLAVQAEEPIVIVESQRPGPASGVPTYQAQGDLLFSLSAGHGDIVKFVVAPGDAEEAFYWTAKAMNLAWQYQTPVIVLIDKELSETTFSFNPQAIKIEKEEARLWNKEGEYKRYFDVRDGISPLAFPGDKAIVKVTSYEHDELGRAVEDAKLIKKMQEKRKRKFKLMQKEAEKTQAINVLGKAKIALICFGSVKGAVKETAKKLGLKMVQPLILQPFPEKQMKKALQGVEKIICVENNASGQLARLLSGYGIKVDENVLKYDGRPFFQEELEEEIKKIIYGKSRNKLS